MHQAAKVASWFGKVRQFAEKTSLGGSAGLNRPHPLMRGVTFWLHNRVSSYGCPYGLVMNIVRSMWWGTPMGRDSFFVPVTCCHFHEMAPLRISLNDG